MKKRKNKRGHGLKPYSYYTRKGTQSKHDQCLDLWGSTLRSGVLVVALTAVMLVPTVGNYFNGRKILALSQMSDGVKTYLFLYHLIMAVSIIYFGIRCRRAYSKYKKLHNELYGGVKEAVRRFEQRAGVRW